jgi:hypothetical protein
MCVEFGREISDRLHKLTQGALLLTAELTLRMVEKFSWGRFFL